MSLNLFVTCPLGLEPVLEQEILDLGFHQVRPTKAGVHVETDIKGMYRINLWTRVANRVLLLLDQDDVYNGYTLQKLVDKVDWSEHLRATGNFKVTFNGKVPGINNSLYGVQLIKDVVVDQFKEKVGVRPSVEKNQPDININVHVSKDVGSLYIDMSGESLHRRGYKSIAGKAPLKENLAAALLYKAKWPEIAKAGGTLIDPFCGSGTFLTEAALMAGDVAPGLKRNYFGFTRWLQHKPSMWKGLIEEARDRRTQAKSTIPPIFGYDSDGGAVNSAQKHLDSLNLGMQGGAHVKPLANLAVPTHIDIKPGLLICNPPYGERISDKASLISLYGFLGEKLKTSLFAWQAAVFTGDIELGFALKMRADKKFQCFNGTIQSHLLQFNPREMPEETKLAIQTDHEVKFDGPIEAFTNRIKKNQKQLKKWLKKEEIECYRLYDADIPEYAVAVDVYGDHLHVQEFKAPKSIDEDKAHRRLMDIIKSLPSVTGIDPEKLVLKERAVQKGTNQYEKVDQEKQRFVVNEHGIQLHVNLRDYLDTGLFLDHRPTRKWIQEHSKGKHFLNLFAYTATASVHAAKGGAKFTTSVDMSNTYMNWAKENFALNGFSERQHHCEVADVFTWLQKDKGQYDMIFMDPPTFSNSKKMRDVLDVQRDQEKLIDLAMARLSEDGLLIFSNNFRRFELMPELEERYDIKEVTKQSIPKDFARRTNIHRCWHIKARKDA